MSKQPDSDKRQQSKGSDRRGGQQKSIKRRVVRLVLVPSVVAVILWLVASGYLVFTGFYDREVAASVRQVSIPAGSGLSSLQMERRLSIAYLARPSMGMQGLIDQRRQTDQRLSTMRDIADAELRRAPNSIKERWKALTGQLDQLPGIRSTIDSGSADRAHVYDFYNGLLGAATDLFDAQARAVPDVTAAQGALVGVETFRASDRISRAGSIITAAFASRRLSTDDYREFVSLVGAYHVELADVAPNFQSRAQKQYEAIVAGTPWKDLTAAEDALIASGRWSAGVPRDLNVNAGNWEALTIAVSDSLMELAVTQADEVSARALRTGSNQLWMALAGSLIALLSAAGAIVWAVRQSQVLVDRALSVRLAQLGRDASTAVHKRLPDMMDRLRRHERVDPAIELSGQDYGSDEIGQLAEVLNRSMKVAVGAAIDEASARTAGVAMLMGVARRPQRPLQHGLQVIEDLQRRVGDETLLAELFDINHQLAQTRRFLENLIILAGGQTGRRFRKPIHVRRILLAAIGETRQYQRITIRRTTDVALVGGAVAGATHLLAELLDNALAFSPPESEVWVSCGQTAQGVVVEIEDAGVGMRPADLERANELLATAPTPDVTMLKDGSQIGLWVVAELAKRGGMRVTFRTSAYGGLLAIVLLPDRLIAAGPDAVSTHKADTAVALTASGNGVQPALAKPTATATLPPMPLFAEGDDGHELRSAEPVVTRPAAESSGLVGPVHTPQTGEGRRNDLARGIMDVDQPRVTTADPSQSKSLPKEVGSATLPEPRPASHPPLPARQPQQHLVPELRDEARALEPAEPARSPEETRARFARYQEGWRAGANTGTADNTNNE